VLANPPFNDSDRHRSDEDVRWKYSLPLKGNANFAWVQQFIYHSSPRGFAGFVPANGSVSSNQPGEDESEKPSLLRASLLPKLSRNRDWNVLPT
jgi:type I restriction enzyme M protein